MKKKIFAPIDMSGWIVLNEEVDTVYMSRDEIEKMQSVDLWDNPHLVDDRGDFILGCLTGLRFSDFSSISALDIHGDFYIRTEEILPLGRYSVKTCSQTNPRKTF